MNLRALLKLTVVFLALFLALTVTGASFAADVQSSSSSASNTTFAPHQNYGSVAVVTAGALNVRSGPGWQHPSQAIIYQGQTVELIGRNYSGSWVKVRLNNGMEGWVNSSYLYLGVPVSTLPVVSTPEEASNAVVTTGAANIRTGPSPAYASIAVVTSGQKLILLGKNTNGSWLYASTPTGLVGWINASLVHAYVSIDTLPVVGYYPAQPIYPAQPVFPAQPIYPPPAFNSGQVATGALNVRSGPGVAYHTIAVLSNGEQVVLLGRNAGSSWVQIQTPSGAVGWVNVYHIQTSVYIPSLPIVDAPAIPIYSPTAVVETGALNVRYGPGPTYGSFTALVHGQVVALQGRNSASTWVQIVTPNGGIGWVNAIYVKTSVPVSSLPIKG